MRARKLTRLGWDDYRKRFVSLGLALEFTQCLIYSFLESLRETRASSYRSTFLRRLGMPIGKKRQASLLSHPPTSNQQDYLLYVILDGLCERSLEEGNPVQPRPTLKTPIFPFPPVVGIASCRCLTRFLSGMGDFERVNAHRPRWRSFPGLRESNTHKRACLFCWTQSRKLLEDSE